MMIRQWCQWISSGIIIVIAILIGWIVQTGRQTISVDVTSVPLQYVRSMQSFEREQFQRDGTVLLKQVLNDHQTQLLKSTIEKLPVQKGGIFDVIQNVLFDQIRFDVWRSDAMVASFALLSLPPIAAAVSSSNNNDKLRLLRDAYFSYQSGSRGCGWHVDDESFWPTLNDTNGVTIWIALDDMDHGGGLMVANRTAFRDENLLPKCRQATRKSTCDMERLAPECHEALEQAAIRTWDVKAGDAIVWDRWVFHRTIPTNHSESSSSSSKPQLQRRYTVRYIPDTAKAFGAIHTSIQQEGSFIGSPYYPQVLPELVPAEMEALRNGLELDFSLLNLFLNVGRFVYHSIVDHITGS